MLSEVVARPTQEQQNHIPKVVLNVTVVSCTCSFAIRDAPKQVLMDIGDQTIMIGKLLAIVLGLTAPILGPCPFTILTSLRSTYQTIGQTK